MIRNRYLLLFFLFLGLSSYSQSSKIKWGLYGKKTVEERRATFPFSEAKKVVLVAFPSPYAVFEDEEDDNQKRIARTSRGQCHKHDAASTKIKSRKRQ